MLTPNFSHELGALIKYSTIFTYPSFFLSSIDHLWIESMYLKWWHVVKIVPWKKCLTTITLQKMHKHLCTTNASSDIFCELCLVCFQIVKIWDIQIWDVGPPFKKYLIILKQNDHHLSQYCDLCISFFSKNVRSLPIQKIDINYGYYFTSLQIDKMKPI
jgi:hypothetical protein